MTGSRPQGVEPTQAELDYVSGIERLDDPTPVRLVISESGVEIIEIMPGSRRILIAAGSVIDARVSDGGKARDEDLTRRPWWLRLALSPFRKSRGVKIPGTESREYALTITYREGDETLAAVFRRRGSSGLLMIQAVTRAIVSMARLRSSPSDVSNGDRV